MAPEQVKGLELTEQVDVYSFGVLLFELVTGAKPITGETVERIFYIILNEPLDLSPLAAANAPEELRALVAACTAKSPEDRPQGFTPICAALDKMMLATIGMDSPLPTAPRQPLADWDYWASGSPTATPEPMPKAQSATDQNPSATKQAPSATHQPATIADPAPSDTGQAPRPAGGFRWRRFFGWIGLVVAAILGTAFGLAWLGYHQLDSNIHAEADGVSAAGIGSDGLITIDALHRLDALRGNIEVVDRYHRQGGPLGYRIGELIWGDLYGPARRLYFERFHTFFLGPAHNNQLQFLLGLPATTSVPYGSVYEALKAYLMTTSEPAKGDVKFLVPVMLHWWGFGLSVSAERNAAALRQFQFYAAELLRDPFAADSDTAAVSKARQYLGQFSPLDRVYALLLADAESHYPAVSFNGQFPGSAAVLTDPHEVSGAFTKAGWEFVHDAISQSERYVASESWVWDGNAAAPPSDPHLEAEVSARYSAAFIETWRQYLQSATLASFATLKDAAQKLKLLAGDHQFLTWTGTQWTAQSQTGSVPSPLDQWLSLAALNTAVDAPAVAAIFQPVQAAQAGSQRYRDLLGSLSSSLDSAAVGDAASLDMADHALQAAKQIEASFNTEAGGQIGAIVGHMFEEPIAAARSLLRPGGPAVSSPRSPARPRGR